MPAILHWLRFALASLAIASIAACACPLLASPQTHSQAPASDPHACCHATQSPQPADHPQKAPSCCDQHANLLTPPAPQFDAALASLAAAPFLFTLPDLSTSITTPRPPSASTENAAPPDFPSTLTLLSQHCQFLV